MKSYERLNIATIGKCVGLGGELKLHLHTDFIDQFKKGSSFTLDDGRVVEIEKFNNSRMLVKFVNYNVREDSAVLVNKHLFTTIEDTKKSCPLEDGQYYWFELEGVEVVEDSQTLGRVEEVERIGNTDYLIVKTDKSLLEEKSAKKFYIPYIDAYIEKFDKDNSIIYTKNALSIFENS
jgi:16S rRNA processing protein RimM